MTFEIDGFTPLGVIGQGGFGTVHRAADDAHGREVAIKVLGRIADDSARRRFDRERRAMGTLSGHPTIGIVYTSGFTANEEPYIVMEMVRGGSLADRLEKDGPLPAAEVVELGATLAEALDHAHQGGVLHLDLKPENILMSRFGKPKIVDFGIAAIVDDESATSTIRATPSYADPHVLEGHPGTAQSDVYGLAATLYTLLAGSPPYSGGPSGLFRVMQRVALDPVPKVERDDVSPQFAELLHSAMAKEPGDRPQSMAEFAQRLRDVDAELVSDRRSSPRSADRRGKQSSGEGQRPRLPTAIPTPTPPLIPAPPPDAVERLQDPPVAQQADVATHSGNAGDGWPQQHLGASSVPRSPNRRRSTTTAVAVLVTLAVILAAALAIVVRRGQDSGDASSSTNGQEAITSEPVTSVDLDALVTDGGMVPDVVGLSTADAREVVSASGFDVAIPAHCYDAIESQSPAAGAVVTEETLVSLQFPPCVVPDFVGLRLPEARRIVDDEFVVGLLINWPAHCDDLVLGQSVPADTIVDPGTEIALTLEDDCSNG